MELGPCGEGRGEAACSVRVEVAWSGSVGGFSIVRVGEGGNGVLVSLPRTTASSTRSSGGTMGIFAHIFSSVNGMCVWPG